MELTKATYRRALRLAENEVYSRADILQRAKDNVDAAHNDLSPDLIGHWILEDEARTEYFKALDLLGAIKDRAKREGYVR